MTWFVSSLDIGYCNQWYYCILHCESICHSTAADDHCYGDTNYMDSSTRNREHLKETLHPI